MKIGEKSVRFFDAHNHLQDQRFAGRDQDLVDTAAKAGVARMVVNGSCESDWPEVVALAKRHPMVIPSLGYHPWHLKERTQSWKETLARLLESTWGAVGEIGLDRWIPDYDLEDQVEVFSWQLRLAAERNWPVSIHCLKAWGRLQQVLEEEPRPARGFLLHSYGGPVEMVAPLVKLGAYFSFPGYFLLPRKQRQRETFCAIPRDRLLVETDAPDQPLPPEWSEFTLLDPASGTPLNHPANLRSVYIGLAEVLGLPLEELAGQVETNFHRLFVLGLPVAAS